MNWNDYYSLLQGFDLFGRKLYPDSWNGWEHQSEETPSPATVEQTRKPIEDEIKRVELEWGTVASEINDRLLDDSERAELEQRIEQLKNRRNQLQDDLQQIAKPDASYKRGYAAYQRSQTVQTRLFEAFEKETIRAHFNGSMLIDWSGWLRQKGCKVVLQLSILRTNELMAGKRWGAVSIEKVAFDKWLSTQSSLEGEISALDQARIEFQNLLSKEVSAGEKRYPRDHYLEIGTRDYQLSRNEAKRVWRATVPASWQRKGRLPKLVRR
ncbi:hypothetical protein GH722_20165 [Alphaproteobacteria bacterium HT1-32]|nr:hypothetical protein [Alphaproteobacteria bacterium HT1-32]